MFYLIGIDVGRYRNATVIQVIKVLPGADGFKKNLIYTESIQGENYIAIQAPRIKKLIQLYNPREVVIDGNGPGIGLLDAMALPSMDSATGEQFPPYYAFNNEYHLPPNRKTPTDDPIPESNAIIYDIKAGNSNNDAIYANFYAQLSNGTIGLLANEQVVKDKLLATKKGAKMSAYDRRAFLLPYENTSRLVDELNNLRLKPTGLQNQFKVEQISHSIDKDRVSALIYGLYRVKYYEDKALKKRKTNNFSQYVFFTNKDHSRT